MTEINEQIVRKNRNFMLHVLRNPFGWSDDVVREMRLKAADELERLYYVESAAKQAAEDFSRAAHNDQLQGPGGRLPGPAASDS